jgi:hypothetical protein
MTKFARWVFLLAGVWGLLTLTPLYFLQGQIAAASGPITHPEYFYGFVGVGLTWQLLFVLISRDPARWRPVMPVAVLEKASFGLPVIGLFAAGKISPTILVFGCIDLIWGVLFAVVFLRLRAEATA